MNPTELFAPVEPPHSPAKLRTAISRDRLGALGQVAEFLARCGVQPGIPEVGFVGCGSGPARDSLIDATGPLAELASSPGVRQVFLPADVESHTADSPPAAVRPALDRQTMMAALADGAACADSLIDSGVDLIIPASLSSSTELPATAILGTLTSTEPVTVWGFHGVDDTQWSQDVATIRDLMFRGREHAHAAVNLVASIGDADIARLIGLIVRSAGRRTPVLLDTLTTSVAALVGERMAPGTKAWLLAGQLTRMPAHLLALRALSITPVFALNMPLGAGAGALATLPLARAASRLY